MRVRGVGFVMVAVAVLYAAPLAWVLVGSAKPESQALSPSAVTRVGEAEVLRSRVALAEARRDPRLAALREELAGAGDGAWRPLLSARWWSGAASIARDNYARVLADRDSDFVAYARNSLIVAGLNVPAAVASSAVVAFGFSRLRWRGRDAAFVLVLATMMVPFSVLMAPQYLLFKHLGWIGTFRPLWVPALFGHAFTIFLLRQFFMGVPRELDEAARLDGCTDWGVFRRVLLPLSVPALAVAALLQVVACWNDYAAPLVFLNHEEDYTLALGLQMYQTRHGGTPWNLVMAASVLVVLPVLVLFILTQRAMTRGISMQGMRE